jgi:hypothetical protein
LPFLFPLQAGFSRAVVDTYELGLDGNPNHVCKVCCRQRVVIDQILTAAEGRANICFLNEFSEIRLWFTWRQMIMSIFLEMLAHKLSPIKSHTLLVSPVFSQKNVGKYFYSEFSCLFRFESSGESGPNREYLFNLGNALRKLEVHDAHVFELEKLVVDLLNLPM